VQLLDAYRRAHAMPSEARVRVRRRLAGGAAVVAAADPRGRWIAGAFAVAAALLLAVWGVWRGRDAAQSSADDAARDQAAFDREADSAQGEADVRPASHGTSRSHSPSETPANTPEVEPALVEPEPTAVAPTEPNPRRSRPRAKDPDPSPGPSSLDQEREVMARAWRALARDDYDAALEVTREHAERFARAILEIERRAVERIVACKRKEDGAASAAVAFLARHGRTPVARQVREACGLDGEKKSTEG
jgi:hypothetical protein